MAVATLQQMLNTTLHCCLADGCLKADGVDEGWPLAASASTKQLLPLLLPLLLLPASWQHSSSICTGTEAGSIWHCSRTGKKDGSQLPAQHQPHCLMGCAASCKGLAPPRLRCRHGCYINRLLLLLPDCMPKAVSRNSGTESTRVPKSRSCSGSASTRQAVGINCRCCAWLSAPLLLAGAPQRQVGRTSNAQILQTR